MATETTQRMPPPQAARAAHGVHHLAEQVLVGQALGLPPVPGALDDLPAEPVDLVGRQPSEVVVEGLAALQLLAVHEDGGRTRQRAALLVGVAARCWKAAHHCYREKPRDGEDDKADDLRGDERREAERNNEAARLWISGLEAVNRTLGLARVIDLW
jgi:hypothetical protein